MLAAVYHGVEDIRIEETPSPKIGAGELLLRVRSCGLCGTDLAKYRHRLVEPPAVLGHEVAGEILEAGEGVERFRPGDRVVLPHHIPCFTCVYCRHGSFSMCQAWRETQIAPGGFAEVIRVGAPSVSRGMMRIPPELGFDEATLAEPAACCLRALERCGLGPGDTLAVIGSGPAGLLHVQLARVLGAAKIIALDLAPSRLEMARRFGADVTVNPSEEDAEAAVRNATAGIGVDVALTAVGSAAVVKQALRLVRKGGTVNVFAECPPGSQIPIDPNLMYHSEVTLLGSYCSSPREMRIALDMIASGRIDAASMITHRLPLADAAKAFELALAARDCLKIVLNP